MDNKVSVGFDKDDFLVQTTAAFLRFYRERTGKVFTVEELTDYRHDRTIGIHPDDWRKWELEFYESEHNAQIPLMPGALALVNAWQQVFDIHIITARPRETEPHLLYTLSQHFGSHAFTRIHMTHSLYQQRGVHKWQVCKEHNIQMLCDDYHGHLNEAAKHGIHGILLDSPWNRNVELHPLVQRIYSLEELL